jgi:hypothetical protein
MRFKECLSQNHLEQPFISAVTENSFGREHCMPTWILVDWIVREVIEIELHPNFMNRENGLVLWRPWKPLFHSLKEQRSLPHEDTQQ